MKRTILFLCSILIVGSCNNKEEKKPEPEKALANTLTLTPEQLHVAGVVTGKLSRKTISSSIKVNGLLDVPPQNLVTISAPMGGFVKQTHLLQGVYVKKGEAIVTLQHQDYIQLQQDYLQSRSQLEFLDAEYKRQQELAAENVNAQKTLQQARAQYESMKAAVAGLASRLEMINITPEKIVSSGIQPSVTLYSPISGYVTEVNVNLGKFVTSTDILFKIVDPSHLHAELYVFEKDVPNLRIDQPVHFSLTNESRVREASIHLIGKEIATDRTVRIHCHLEQDYPDLIPGMYLKAWIETAAKETDVLPEEAIVNFEGTDYIFTTRDNKTFLLTEITKGISGDDVVEVLPVGDKKITGDMQIVIAGAYDLLSMLKNTEEE